MSKVEITNTKFHKIVSDQEAIKERDKNEELTQWIIYSRKWSWKMKLRKIILTVIEVDSHHIIIVDWVVQTHKVKPKIDKIKKVMINSDMDNNRLQTQFKALEEVVLFKGIEQLVPITVVVILLKVLTQMVETLEASNLHLQHPSELEISSTQH